jgi:hypothetical protein
MERREPGQGCPGGFRLGFGRDDEDGLSDDADSVFLALARGLGGVLRSGEWFAWDPRLAWVFERRQFTQRTVAWGRCGRMAANGDEFLYVEAIGCGDAGVPEA